MADPTEASAASAQTPPAVSDGTPAVAPEITNSEAKNLPWVKELMRKSAELDQFKAQQEEARATAEVERAKAEGDYKKALELEQAKVAKIEADAAARVQDLELSTEFIKSGLADPRAVRIFAEEYNKETETIPAFVARLKADEANASYFRDLQKRQAHDPPPASGGGGLVMSIAEYRTYLKSGDPAKRAKAADFSAAYWDEHGEMPPKQ